MMSTNSAYTNHWVRYFYTMCDYVQCSIEAGSLFRMQIARYIHETIIINLGFPLPIPNTVTLCTNYMQAQTPVKYTNEQYDGATPRFVENRSDSQNHGYESISYSEYDENGTPQPASPRLTLPSVSTQEIIKCVLLCINVCML